MRIDGQFQFAGQNALREVLQACLQDESYTRFRFSVAFARWSGLALLDEDLQAFALRTRTGIEAFVGIDLGGTTIEALTYLYELPKTRVSVVQSNMNGVVFHPKVFDFSGPAGSLSVVGSSNLTTGGLFSNIEASLVVACGEGEANPVDQMFRWLKPTAPFTASHVRRVSAELLDEVAPGLDRYTKRSPDWNGSPNSGDPLDPAFKFPKIGRPPSLATRDRKGKSAASRSRHKGPVRTGAVPATGNDELFLELWDETGGGTQVQIPKTVYVDYFGADPSAVTWIKLDTPAGSVGPMRLQFFSNVTFRIGLPFVGTSPQGAGRRAVLRFVRTAPDEYQVRLRRRGQQGYEAWLSNCVDRTNRHSKGYGIVKGPSARRRGSR